jgi:peptide methionine sulfoxide reductase MsrA
LTSIGCYWGTEKFFKKDFGIKAFSGSGVVKNGKVGFMGPPEAKKNPTYREVIIPF